MPADTDTVLRYGYTLSEINKLASVAVWRDVWHQSLPLSERQDIAWSAVFDGDQTMPGFASYWFTLGRNTPGPEERIVKRIAFGQIWEALSEQHQVLIAALAMTDDYGKAAAALGRPTSPCWPEPAAHSANSGTKAKPPPATGAPTAAGTPTRNTTRPTPAAARQPKPCGSANAAGKPSRRTPAPRPPSGRAHHP